MTSREFLISSGFDAPKEVVWRAFTEPERMKQWWGPKGAEILSCKIDLRPGGLFHYRMEFMGQEMWGKMVYREIEPPKRIVFINSFSDEQGGVTRHPMAPTWPREMHTTVTLDEQGGQPAGQASITTFTVRWAPLNPTPEEQQTFDAGHGSMRQGWTGTFERLAGYLAKTVNKTPGSP
jgi:uncharacterized protein YndB with AHSA1/START domain